MIIFDFFKEKTEITKSLNFRTVDIPKEIHDEKSMLKLYASKLDFPDYFGENWDAFEECLNDLSFIKEKTVLIIHDDLPFDNSPNDQRIYIEILYRAVKEWQAQAFFLVDSLNLHELRVFFPQCHKRKILEIILKYEAILRTGMKEAVSYNSCFSRYATFSL